MKEEWVLSIRNQCRRASVAFFFKRWNLAIRKRAETGRTLDGRIYSEFPERGGSAGWRAADRLAVLRDVETEYVAGIAANGKLA